MRLILLLLFSKTLLSQQKKLDTVFCDCNNAKVITVTGKTSYGKTIAPVGFGELKEISPKKQHTEYAFEKEHNSAWYKLIINVSGELTFNIVPTDTTDDYDFMLFKSTKNNFCDSLRDYNITPIRSCISRDKDELNGKTGLSISAKNEYVKHGVGPAYCKSIAVQKREIYYLVLDNVHEKGSGHYISFEIAVPVLFKGVVTDEQKRPIKTEIALTNQAGDTITIQNTTLDGIYSFMAPINKNQEYNLNFYNDSSFSFTKTISLKDTVQLKSLKTILPQLKKGSKYSVGSINFIGGSVQYLPRAIPAMNNLAKLLKKNKNLKIKIIGHSNGRDMHDEAGIIAFTKGRATSIKNYLAIQGIDEKRIEIDGRGDHEMLYQLSKANAEQQEQNRRVEVLVLEF